MDQLCSVSTDLFLPPADYLQRAPYGHAPSRRTKLAAMMELMGEIKLGSFQCAGSTDMCAVWTVTAGHTGRVVRGAEAHKRALAWSELKTVVEMKADPTFQDIEALIIQAPLVAAETTGCLRGRGIEDPPPTRERMGPRPSSSKPQEGRYSVPGCQVLYLSDSEDGVVCELNAWHVKGEPWVQRYSLPTAYLRIGDFSQLPENHLLNSAFSLAEDCKVQERGGPDSYDLSNLLASVAAQRFDGMRIPGVRATEPSHRYNNVVIFRPHIDWTAWLDGDPYLLVPTPKGLH